MNNLHPPGMITMMLKYNRVVITNALPSVCDPQCSPAVTCLQTTEHGFEAKPALMWLDFCAMGMVSPGQRVAAPRPGKFVCFRDGMFLIGADDVPHIEMPYMVGRRPGAVIGAGFITVKPMDHLELSGVSVSLSNLEPRLDYRDYNAIAQHLQLTCEARDLEYRMEHDS